MLYSGYTFVCTCEDCSLPAEQQAENDQLRTEAWQLSQTQCDLRHTTDTQQLGVMLEKTERWLHLRQHLGYKVS